MLVSIPVFSLKSSLKNAPCNRELEQFKNELQPLYLVGKPREGSWTGCVKACERAVPTSSKGHSPRVSWHPQRVASRYEGLVYFQQRRLLRQPYK